MGKGLLRNEQNRHIASVLQNGMREVKGEKGTVRKCSHQEKAPYGEGREGIRR